jgi:protein SCO1/2
MILDRRRAVAGVAAVVLCGGAAGCTDDDSTAMDESTNGLVSAEAGGGSFLGAEPVAPYTMPDVTLTATNGEPFNLIVDTGYPNTIVFYGYTHCTEVCPLVMSDLTSAYLQLPTEVRDDTQVVFITTDPARDTVPVLREYLDHYDEDFVGLTGDLDDITTAAQAMGVAIEGMKELPSGGYNVGHGAQVIGFHDNQAPVIWTEGTSADVMATDIEELAGR